MKKILLSLVAVLAGSILAHAGEIPDISADALKKAISEKSVTLIDVNGSASYQEGHIPGAIDFAVQSGDLAKVLPANKDALVVAYCGNEHCGAYKAGADAAKKLGYTNVQHFKPGIAGWKAMGEPTVKGS